MSYPWVVVRCSVSGGNIDACSAPSPGPARTPISLHHDLPTHNNHGYCYSLRASMRQLTRWWDCLLARLISIIGWNVKPTFLPFPGAFIPSANLNASCSELITNLTDSWMNFLINLFIFTLCFLPLVCEVVFMFCCSTVLFYSYSNRSSYIHICL